MILFITFCIMTGLFILVGIGLFIWSIFENEIKDGILVFLMMIILSFIPGTGVIFGMTANNESLQEIKYQELQVEYETLCSALNRSDMVDIGITSKVVEYNTKVAKNKARRQNKWFGYYIDAAYERVEVIDY